MIITASLCCMKNEKMRLLSQSICDSKLQIFFVITLGKVKHLQKYDLTKIAYWIATRLIKFVRSLQDNIGEISVFAVLLYGAVFSLFCAKICRKKLHL